VDEQITLTPPENVPISYELAGLGSRFAAAVLDSIIVFAVQVDFFLVAFFAWSVGVSLAPTDELTLHAGTLAVAAVVLLGFVATLGYPMFFEIVWSGQTPGKRAIGIRIVLADGGPVTASAAVIRNVIRIADFLPAYYIIGAVVMLADRKARRLGDMAAGTICVKERKASAGGLDLASAPLRENESGEAGVLARLSPDDRRLLEEYLVRRGQLTPEAASNLARQIAERLATRLEVEPAGESPESFLVRVGAALKRERESRASR
jgi:uncharacterized RDD family membrane protein YckC